MKLKTIRQGFYDGTGTLSNNCRTFAIAALGLIWLFKTVDSAGNFILPLPLIEAARLVVIAMALDFLQYLYKSGIWFYKTISHEKWVKLPDGATDREEAEFVIGYRYTFPIDFLLFAKTVPLACAYYKIIEYLDVVIKST